MRARWLLVSALFCGLPSLAKQPALPNPTFELKLSSGNDQHPIVLRDEFVTQESALIISGSVRDSSGGIARCEVSVNDRPLSLLPSNPGRTSVKLNIAVPLKAERNELTLRIYYERGPGVSRGVVKKSYWIMSRPKLRQQWAVVIGISRYPVRRSIMYGSEDARAMTAELRTRGTTVYELIDEEATTQNIVSALHEISEKVGHDDSVLFYFSGGGYSQLKTGEPYLMTFDSDPESKYRGLSLTELFWQFGALHLPSLAVALDTCFTPTADQDSKSLSLGSVQASPVAQSSAAWLSPLEGTNNIDVLLSSRFYEASYVDHSSGHGLFTREFLNALDNDSARSTCITLPEVGHIISIRMGQFSTVQHPLSFSTSKQSGFCFNAVITNSVAQHEESDVRTAPLFSGFDNSAPSIKVEFPRLSESQSYNSKAIRVMFVISDPTINTPAAYQITDNNNVVLRRGWTHSHRGDKRQILTWVPLAEGQNTISIQTDNAKNRYAETTFTVDRRPSEPIQAVIIGVSKYESSQIGSVKFAQSDARFVAQAVLDFTQAKSSDISLLVGSRATRDNIRQALTSANVGVNPDPSKTTLIFYFAGYGTTLVPRTKKGSYTRCFVPFDARAEDLGNTCISTDEMSRWIQNSGWKNQIVIIDTSYDSASEHSWGGMPFSSRTLGDFHSYDSDWRLNANVEENRISMVAGTANEDALEDEQLQHGVFTYSFVNALRSLASGSSDNSNSGLRDSNERHLDSQQLSMSLADIYPRVLLSTRDQTGGRQNPVLKGNLSKPFSFRKVKAREILAEARTEVEMSPIDTMSMRAPNESILLETNGQIQKVLNLELGSDDARGLEFDRIVSRVDGGIIDTRLAVAKRSSIAPPPELGPVLGFSSPEELGQEAADRFKLARDDITSLLNGKVSSEDALLAKTLMRDTLTGSALLNLQAARLPLALADAKEAISTSPTSPVAQFVAAQVFAASGNYSDCVNLFTNILIEHRPAALPRNAGLTQEQLGMTFLWKVVSLFLSGDRFHSGRTNLYARSGSREGTIRRQLLEGLALLPGLKRSVGEVVAEGAIQTDSTWPREVANYLVNRRSEIELRSFARNENDADPRSPAPFQCSVEFYVGLKDLMEHRREEAATHFQNAVDTNQTQLLEYWFSRSQLSPLSK